MTNYLDRLLKAIPGGAHVHSKGYDSYPSTAPKITSKGKGAYLYDENNNKYLDYGMAFNMRIVQWLYRLAVLCLTQIFLLDY